MKNLTYFGHRLILLLLLMLPGYNAYKTRNMMGRNLLPGGFQRVSLQDPENTDRVIEFQKAAIVVLESLTDPLSTPPPPAYTFMNTIQTTSSDKLAIQVVRVYEQVVAGLNLNMVVAVYTTDEVRRQLRNDSAPYSSQQQQRQTDSANELTLESCVGAFAVSVYDRFGDISITRWAQETSCEKALAIWTSDDSFADNGVLDQGGE